MCMLPTGNIATTCIYLKSRNYFRKLNLFALFLYFRYKPEGMMQIFPIF